MSQKYEHVGMLYITTRDYFQRWRKQDFKAHDS